MLTDSDPNHQVYKITILFCYLLMLLTLPILHLLPLSYLAWLQTLKMETERSSETAVSIISQKTVVFFDLWNAWMMVCSHALCGRLTYSICERCLLMFPYNQRKTSRCCGPARTSSVKFGQNTASGSQLRYSKKITFFSYVEKCMANSEVCRIKNARLIFLCDFRLKYSSTR
jgi:hypothetical protein